MHETPQHSIIPREEWRPVPGFEGRYSASRDGRVRHNKSGRIHRRRDPRGYVILSIATNGKPRSWGAHHLVALAWVPGRSGKRWQVNHKNGVKHDNRADNLEWTSASENAKHAVRTGLYVHEPVWRGKRKLTPDDVRFVRRVFRPHCREYGAAALARRYGLTTTSMLAAINGRTWKHVE